MSRKPRKFLQPLLNEREFAALFGVSVRTVQDWRQTGQGPPFLKLSDKKRGIVRYDPADVMAFIRERRVRSTLEGLEIRRPRAPSDPGSTGDS